MTRSVKRTRHRSRQRVRPKTRRKTRQRVKRRTKNYSKKRKNTRKKNYSKKVIQEGGMLGCFGKEKLVEEGENANDVFRRLITEVDELPQDTTLEVFGIPDRGGDQRRLFRLSYTHHDRWLNLYHFQNYGGNEVVFDFPGRLLLELLDETSVRAGYPVIGQYKEQNIFYIFYNYEFGGAGVGHRHLNVLQSDKINEGVDKNRKKAAKKAAKKAGKRAKRGEPVHFQHSVDNLPIEASPESETGFTVPTESQTSGPGFTVPTGSHVYQGEESQPKSGLIQTQLIDASMEVAFPASPDPPSPRRPPARRVHPNSLHRPAPANAPAPKYLPTDKKEPESDSALPFNDEWVAVALPGSLPESQTSETGLSHLGPLNSSVQYLPQSKSSQATAANVRAVDSSVEIQEAANVGGVYSAEKIQKAAKWIKSILVNKEKLPYDTTLTCEVAFSLNEDLVEKSGLGKPSATVLLRDSDLTAGVDLFLPANPTEKYTTKYTTNYTTMIFTYDHDAPITADSVDVTEAVLSRIMAPAKRSDSRVYKFDYNIRGEKDEQGTGGSIYLTSEDLLYLCDAVAGLAGIIRTILEVSYNPRSIPEESIEMDMKIFSAKLRSDFMLRP